MLKVLTTVFALLLACASGGAAAQAGAFGHDVLFVAAEPVRLHAACGPGVQMA